MLIADVYFLTACDELWGRHKKQQTAQIVMWVKSQDNSFPSSMKHIGDSLLMKAKLNTFTHGTHNVQCVLQFREQAAITIY